MFPFYCFGIGDATDIVVAFSGNYLQQIAASGSELAGVVVQFQFEVVRVRQRVQSIVVEGVTLASARHDVESRGYVVLACRPVPILKGAGVRTAPGNRVDLLVFAEQLRDLLIAGLSLVEALAALRGGTAQVVASLVQRLEASLRGGLSLSDAMARESTSFPAPLVALVRSSELTSDLPRTLDRYLEHERQLTEVRHRVVSIAIYPALLTVIGLGVLAFMLFYVMPRFARVFEGIQGALPWAAQAMLAWSRFLAAHGPLLLAGLAGLGVLFGALAVQPTLRARLAAWLLDLGPVRRRLTTYFLARWYRGTGMLVAGGIPLAEALGLSQALLPLALRSGGAAVEHAVRAGLSPAAAFASAGMATPIAEQLLLAGERTGDLGAVLTRVAAFHEAEVSRALERAMRSLEPLVMVAIGLGVGLVVVLMYLPIFELASAIQ